MKPGRKTRFALLAFWVWAIVPQNALWAYFVGWLFDLDPGYVRNAALATLPFSFWTGVVAIMVHYGMKKPSIKKVMIKLFWASASPFIVIGCIVGTLVMAVTMKFLLVDPDNQEPHYT